MLAVEVVREQLVLLVPLLSVDWVGLEQYRTLLDRLLPTQEVGALMVLGLLDLVAQEVAAQDLLQEREPMEQPTRVAVLVVGTLLVVLVDQESSSSESLVHNAIINKKGR
jgi:hypothetical protein